MAQIHTSGSIYIELDWRSEFKRLEGAYATSTIRSYYSDVEIFAQWCEGEDLVPLPAAVGTVCMFLEAQSPGLAAATVRRRLHAIRKGHRLLNLQDPTRKENISLTFRRIRRAKLTRPKQAKGLTRKYLERSLAI